MEVLTLDECFEQVLGRFVSQEETVVVYREFEPREDTQQFKSNIAEQFGFPSEMNDLLRDVVELFEHPQSGIHVHRELKSPRTGGSHGKFYPAQFEVTVTFR